MSQRQFRSDDTSKWKEGFGNGSKGNLTIANSQVWKVANGTDFTTDGNAYGTFNGTAGDYSGSATDVWGMSSTYVSPGAICLIHQTRGTGVGNWELNVITGGVGAGPAQTPTFKYPLVNTYITSGASCAQIIVCYHYNNLTVNSGKVLTALAWNGATYGGVEFLLAKNTITLTGSLSGNYTGYLGAVAHNTGDDGFQGEGSPDVGIRSTSANGNSGGGATKGSDPNHSGGGGGGGHASVGGNGQYDGGLPGTGGNAVGGAELTTLFMGGGGGNGSAGTGHAGGPGGAGGTGGGIIFLMAKNIIVGGGIACDGNNASGDFAGEGGGGGGAGGSILLKGMNVTLGSNIITANLGTGAASSGIGGNGAYGRINLDYSLSYTGTVSTPSINVRNDTSIRPPNKFMGTEI